MDRDSAQLIGFLAFVFVLFFAVSVALAMLRKPIQRRLHRFFPGGDLTGRISKNLRITVGPDGSEEVFGHTAFAAGTNPALPKDLHVESIESVPLTARQRERYLESWKETQELFERAPSEAVREADRLLAELLPDGATLSMPVEQKTLTGNDIVEALGMIKDVQRIARNARGAARGIALAKQHRDASTEDLTLAMDHYRVLFDRVLGDDRAPGL